MYSIVLLSYFTFHACFFTLKCTILPLINFYFKNYLYIYMYICDYSCYILTVIRYFTSANIEFVIDLVGVCYEYYIIYVSKNRKTIKSFEKYSIFILKIYYYYYSKI